MRLEGMSARRWKGDSIPEVEERYGATRELWHMGDSVCCVPRIES